MVFDCSSFPLQTEAAETDGFQADTEDDEDDCIIVSTHNGQFTWRDSCSLIG